MGPDPVQRAYTEALRRVITPGAVVLDLGGDFARRAVVACRLGAGCVYSLQSPSARTAADAVASANACGDIIRSIETLDALPPGGDVVIAEWPGDRPLFGRSLIGHPAARERLEKGAAPIPRSERLSAAIVEAPELYHRHAGVWHVGYGLDFSVARRLALNSWSPAGVRVTQLLVEPKDWGTVDYTALTALIGGQMEWTFARTGVAHGVAMWTDVTFAEGVVLHNAPRVADMPFEAVFFPWREPVEVAVGDRVSITIRGDALGRGDVWTWTCAVTRAGADPVAFKQSTFLGSLESPCQKGVGRH